MLLRDNAIAIWRAGVQAVDSAMAVQRQIVFDGNSIQIADLHLDLTKIGRFEVLGAGKAGAGMASGVEEAMLSAVDPSKVSGWVNVPADCVRPLKRIHLHSARPAGINEPTAAGVEGTNEILRRIRNMTTNDVCIVLLSGGASALLCSPVSEISLADKLAVTRKLAMGGAPIHELNLVRTQLSQVKGGRLAASCKAGTLVALIISDVIGDPLDVIGSGPTTRSPVRADQALRILSARDLTNKIPLQVVEYLRSKSRQEQRTEAAFGKVTNVVVASNSIAMAAATTKAAQLGYRILSLGSANAGDAATEGRQLFQTLKNSLAANGNENPAPLCILSGGEPTVNLNDHSTEDLPENETTLQRMPAKGGRNQELVLAAIAACPNASDWKHLALLSGGTDGEDGPTDAAGAFADASIVEEASRLSLQPASHLKRHDSYPFFEAVGGLLKTGPTHTNVMDLRIGLVDCGRQLS